MSSMWGEQIKLSIFGGSHTYAIGVTVDGLPAGEKINMEQVMEQMARRAPGRDNASTQRKESDVPQIICGMDADGVLTGDPLTALIYNSDQHSKDYSNLKITPRPGHADYTAYVKYRGYNDIRGGGHFSGRLTAPLVFAGAICRQILSGHNIYVGAHAFSIGNCFDTPFSEITMDQNILCKLSGEYFPVIDQKKKEQMYKEIENVRIKKDSIGGIVECAVIGLPVGLGAPIFGGVENVISSIVFGIPAIKGIEFGAGFSAAGLMGSEHNDPYRYEDETVKTTTNNSGGILGGITNGMPVLFRAAIKPTPSISREQDTVNLQTGENANVVVHGRHDPCIVPRAVPVVEAAAAVAVMELMSQNGNL